MSFINNAPQLVSLHADCLKDADGTHPLVPVPEPEANDAAACPEVYEALEAQLWQGAQQHGAEQDQDLLAVADVGEVLHPVSGIELDA